MTLLQEILNWSNGLPPWQSDAVARLLLRGSLSSEDEADLFALLKLSQGIPDPGGRIPKPLTEAQIPHPAEGSTEIKLLAIKNMINVNAIASNQRLSFIPVGLTVIYGDNGSGKSGYSRVLKRACRARDQREVIHPDVRIPTAPSSAAVAVFEISIDNDVQEIQWSDELESPPELSSLAVFDSRCARSYLESEDDYSYVPYGLEIFEGLAQLCKRLKQRVESEINASSPDLSVFNPLCGETEVGRLINNLSAETSRDSIQALASLTSEEVANHSALQISLNEKDPKEKANQLRNLAKRLDTVARRIVEKAQSVDQEVVTKFQALSQEYRISKAAAELAAEQFRNGERLLPETGGEVWRELFEAARKFAAVAHPGKLYPNLGADSPCPLCQQPLAEGASRLIRFEEFIQEDTEKTAQTRRQALYTQYKPFVEINFDLNVDEVTSAEITGLDPQLIDDIKAFERLLHGRQQMIKDAVIKHEWDGVEQQLMNPSDRLFAYVAKLNIDADNLEHASDEKLRVELQAKYADLDSRVRLRQVKDSVIKAVDLLDHQARLKKCIGSTRTNSISLKASELVEKVVSKELADSLNSEFEVLGVKQLRVSLQSRSDKGKTLHKLKLELPQSRNPSEILSEGEQRSVAIASFLAETKVSGGKSGIIFDDPVSSLDHRRRERVARRLALEAAHRQVIVFTHDVYFLCLLDEEARSAGINIYTQSLSRRSVGYGVTNPDLPFEAKTTTKRIGELINHHQLIEKLCRDGEEDEHRKQTIDAYFRLRITWERAVEEWLFGGVVLRFRKGIETNRLRSVVVEDSDYEQVYAGMTKCSNYAHDKAMNGGIAIPAPEELYSDIQALDSWLKKLEKRCKEVQKRRKTKGSNM
jgi:energy-coupling factor transporter ATP-binding protein EcfA2